MFLTHIESIYFSLKLKSTKALQLQKDRVTHLSVEMLQLRIIPFEKDYNR